MLPLLKKISLVLFLVSTKAFACSCETPKQILEFYASDYVFQGKAIDKSYASDSLTYTITFEIQKHYKSGDNPATLQFTLPSEGEYTGVVTSCDWNVEKGETWLVYAKTVESQLKFYYFCSHSQPLDGRPLYPKEKKVLERGNSFQLENYIYRSEEGFNSPKPITNIDSILKTEGTEKYEDQRTTLDFFVDETGNLISVNPYNFQNAVFDSVLGLIKRYRNAIKEPLTNFEKDAIGLGKKIKKWEVKYHEKTKARVKYRQHLHLEYDSENDEWKYNY